MVEGAGERLSEGSTWQNISGTWVYSKWSGVASGEMHTKRSRRGGLDGRQGPSYTGHSKTW